MTKIMISKDITMHRIVSNIVVKWLALLHIQEVLGSKIDPETGNGRSFMLPVP
jgi:hypothetical protein